MPLSDFTTPRLQVSHWDAILADPIARGALLRDLPGILTKDVTRELPPSFALTGYVANWVAARQSESDIYVINTGEQLIGLLILFNDAQNAAIHLGYLFAQSTWGQGYATELLNGLVTAAKPPVTLLAGVAATNPASAHVLRKAGFVLDQEHPEGMLSFSQVIEA
jgi:RimJ/RimL family protein N-acetyltransferase